MEISFAGKVYIKQGTIYSYSGNLILGRTSGPAPGLARDRDRDRRLILTDQERELTFTRDDGRSTSSLHLVAAEGPQPRYIRPATTPPTRVVALEGAAWRSVASKPLPLGVSPGMPVSVPRTP